MPELCLGLIGLGGKGSDHLSAAMAAAGVRVVAICDPNLENLHVAKHLCDVPAFTHHLEMMSAVPMDAVLVSVPHDQYPTIVSDAFRHQLHVLKEKPLARSLQEAVDMISQARRAGLVLGVAAQRRFHPAYVLGREVLPLIGDVFLVQARYLFVGGPWDWGWRGNRSIAGGGAILDMGYHVLDLMIWLMGMPEEVYGYMANAARPDVSYDTEDTAVLVLKYGRRTMASLTLSRSSLPDEDCIIVHGTHGSVSIQRTGVRVITHQQGQQKEELWIPTKRAFERSLTEQIEGFAASIRGDKLGKGSAEEHVKTMALAEAAYTAIEGGAPVRPADVLDELSLPLNI